MVLTIIIFQGLVFIGLIFVLRHFMQEHVSGAMGHMQKLNDELLKQQAELKEKIAAAEKEYQTKFTKAQQEVSQMQATAKQEVTKSLEDARARAQLEREKLINEAVDTRDKMRQEIMGEMEQRAIQYSFDLIREFFSEELQKAANDILIKEVIEGLKEVDVESFEIKSDTAELVVPEPLSQESRARLQKVLKEKIKRDIQFKEEVKPDIIAGLVLKFGTLVVDGSLANRLKESSARLKREMTRKYQGKT